MNNRPQPGEIWLVSSEKEENIVSRLMLIISRSEEQDILETLMCTSDLNLTSNKTLSISNLFFLKVSKFQNDFMKLSFLSIYERKIVTISFLTPES